tara:strand:+ start:3762 stop:4034 length:273 start_codon:yes stop_codon:yes gene_type:complete
MFEEASTKKKNSQRDLEIIAMAQVLSTENGRLFMWRCLQNCSVFESIYTSDATLHAFKSGKREHGLWLAAELKEAAPESYFKMLKENDYE